LTSTLWKGSISFGLVTAPIGWTTPRRFLIIGATLVTAACASMPTGPSVLMLPGSGKGHDQFRAEDARCRQRAASEMQMSDHGTVTTQGRYDARSGPT
jgi:hypothetical protein